MAGYFKASSPVLGSKNLCYYLSIPSYIKDFILSSVLLTLLVSFFFFFFFIASGGIGNGLFLLHAIHVMVWMEVLLASPLAAWLSETEDTALAFCASILMGLMCS